MSKCPDCHAEMLTYAQHLKSGCAKHAERMLSGRDLPERTIAGIPLHKPAPRHIERVRGSGAKKSERVGVKCVNADCQNWRIEGKSYCRPCHAKRCRDYRERKRNGTQVRRAAKTECAGGCGGNRAPGQSYCQKCQSAINARNKALRRAKAMPCATCKRADRVPGDSYCRECGRERRVRLREEERKRNAAPVDYRQATWRSKKIGE